MELKDLKNGMVVELRDGLTYIVIDGFLYNENYEVVKSLALDFEDDMTSCFTKEKDMVEVRDYGNLETIWQSQEFDWNKVPVGTKVRVKDREHSNWQDAIFISKDVASSMFRVVVSHRRVLWFQECQLAEEDTLTSKEIDKGHTEYCDKQDGCSDCKYKSERCVIDYILENYNVSKK